MQQAKAYFKDKDDVVEWWNPEEGKTAATFRHGLDSAMIELAKHPEIKTVLDAACGKGRSVKVLSTKYSLTAADISDRMLDSVRALNLKNVKIEQADVENLPFQDASFDAVVCFEALVHIADLKKAFSEFYRVLKPGGVLIVNIDNSYGLLRIIKNITDAFFKWIDQNYKRDRESREQIFRTLKRSDIDKLSDNAGFKTLKHFYIGVLMSFRIKYTTIITPKMFSKIEIFNNFLEQIPLLNRLATYIYFVCQK